MPRTGGITPRKSPSHNITFRYPLRDEIVQIGSEYLVIWTTPTGITGVVPLNLTLVSQYAGASEEKSSYLDNVDLAAGKYTWSISPSLDPGSYYLTFPSIGWSSIFILGNVDNNSQQSGGMNKRTKAGVGIGVAAGVLLLVGLVLWILRQRKRQKEEAEGNDGG